MTTKNTQTTQGDPSPSTSCSLIAMEQGREAVLLADLFLALDKLKKGQTVEVHHPSNLGSPTNMGVGVYKTSDGREIRVFAACWGIVSEETTAWSYTSMGEILLANAEAIYGAGENAQNTNNQTEN